MSRSNEKPRDGTADNRADDISGRRAAGSGESVLGAHGHDMARSSFEERRRR